MHDELKRNGSGYIDPTAEQALKKVSKEEMRVSKVIKTMQSIAHLAGFNVEERIVLRDNETNQIWR